MAREVFVEELRGILESDARRMAALRLVDGLGLPAGSIAGAFVRCAVFDRIHRHAEWTQLSAIDVVYFDPDRTEEAIDTSLEMELVAQAPRRPWRVRNLARERREAKNLAEALTVFPDTASAVAVRLGPRDTVALEAAASDLTDLFGGVLRPLASERAGELRRLVADEKWMKRYPRLVDRYSETD